MPSTLHEALVMLFRESPRLAPLLVARAVDFELPEDADIQVTSAEFAEIDPPEYRADVVLRVAGDKARPAEDAFIVEVQLDIDAVKRFTWPHYSTGARARFRSRATLVVIAMEERVAKWSAQPIETDLAGSVFRPVVIGPSMIPVITDEDQARTWPELAVLSVIAHGRESGSEAIGLAALAGCAQLDNPQGNLYADLVLGNLNEIARTALEALMDTRNYTYQSDFAKKYVAEGVEKGIEKGVEKGIAQGLRTLLCEQLRERFGELPVEATARLDDADADTLTLWGRRVLTAGSLDEVFTGAPR